MNKITKQCVAAVASLAMAGTLCVAGAVVAGSSAWAEDAKPAPWALPTGQENIKGSINIIKWKYNLLADGTQEKAEKVPGAEFTVTKVKKLNKSDNAELNLKSYDDWMKVAAKVSALNANPNDTNLDLDTPKKVTTASKDDNAKGEVKGEAKFPDLEIGLYKVEETKTPAGYAGLSSPFFMTIPEVTSADGKTNTYKYAVQVEPKNKPTDIKKKVDTAGTVGAGDEVPYTITTDVTTTTTNTPDKYTKDDLQGFAVWDDALISAYDGMKNLTNEQAKALVTEVKIGETTIDKSKCNVTVEDSNVDKNGSTATRKRIKVAFTDDGLGDIATGIKTAYNKNKAQLPQLTVKFTFKIASDAPTSGFFNKYGFQPGHGTGGKTPDPVNPPDNDPNTEVTLVKFQIKKVNGANVSEGLKDAKFAVFAKESDANACAADPARPAAKCKDKAAKGLVKGTSGDAIAAGLDGATAGTAENTGLTGAFEVKVGDVYVVETQAPTGFVLSPKVEKVTVQQSGSEYSATDTTFTYTFKDLPNGGPDGSGKNWFNLPATGAAGVIIFALIGLGLVGSGMFVFLKNRKKEEEQAA